MSLLPRRIVAKVALKVGATKEGACSAAKRAVQDFFVGTDIVGVKGGVR